MEKLLPLISLPPILILLMILPAGNSLFKAQIVRAQEMIDLVDKTPPGQLSFVALDEMFNGTSAKESMAAAYSVVKHLGNYAKSICIVATHFPLLTNLEREENAAFENYKVSVNVDDTWGHSLSV